MKIVVLLCRDNVKICDYPTVILLIVFLFIIHCSDHTFNFIVL